MFDQPSTSTDIIRDESYLEPEFIPDNPVAREDEKKRTAAAIQPIIRRNIPENIFVYGPAGIGKTTCVKYVFDKLEEETTAKPVYINCWQYNTRSSLLTEILIQLGYPAPRKGKPVDELLSKIQEWLDKNRAVAVALDEFDQINNPTQITYDLHVAGREAENSLGLVMVSNQPPSEIDLDPRCRSRLNCNILQFEPYNAEQLKRILNRRTRKAFHPGTVSNAVIDRIGKHVAEHSGQSRDALNILRQAGRHAEEHNHSKLTEENVEQFLER